VGAPTGAKSGLCVLRTRLFRPNAQRASTQRKFCRWHLDDGELPFRVLEEHRSAGYVDYAICSYDFAMEKLTLSRPRARQAYRDAQKLTANDKWSEARRPPKNILQDRAEPVKLEKAPPSLSF
jgi:hypothetical protein